MVQFLIGVAVGLLINFVWSGNENVYHYNLNNHLEKNVAHRLEVWFKSPDEIAKWTITKVCEPVISNYRLEREKEGLYHLKDYIILKDTITLDEIKQIINISLNYVKTFETGDNK